MSSADGCRHRRLAATVRVAENTRNVLHSKLAKPSRTDPLNIIRSPQNATIKRLASLRNHRRRRAAGIVLVDGPREIWRAIQAGWHLKGFYEPLVHDAFEAAPPYPEIHQIRAHAAKQDRHFGVDAAAFAKLAYAGSSGICLAELDAIPRTLNDLPANLTGLVLVLDRVEKPGNIGAIFRTADAAAVAAVLLCDCPSDAMNPNSIRGSLGAVFTVPHASGTATEIAQVLTKRAFRPLAMRVEGSRNLFSQDLSGDIAVILGSEADGLGDRWTHVGEAPVDGVCLPMYGQVDSLNVSVSAAIVAFESVRQRQA